MKQLIILAIFMTAGFAHAVDLSGASNQDLLSELGRRLGTSVSTSGAGAISAICYGTTCNFKWMVRRK